MLKTKHIQAAHEVRMWLGTIAIGVAVINGLQAEYPELRWSNLIDRAKKKLGKKQEDKVIKVVVIREGES